MRALLLALLVFTVTAQAAEWSMYANARFGYSIGIPPGFSPIEEAANGDGGVSRSGEGEAELSVWGAYLLDQSLIEDARERIAGDEAEGWRMSFNKVTADFASWSGVLDGRILYGRAVPVCDGAAAYFRIVYPKAQLKAMDQVIKELVRTLRAAPCA